MDEMNDHEWDELAEAIVVWTGKGSLKYPTRSESRLAERFGQDAVTKLLLTIRKLEAEFYASDARYVAADIAEMGKLASTQFQEKYPRLPKAAVDAFAWCYTWDYK